MTSSDLRRIARENLSGNWGMSVLTAFVASIFGALLVSSNVNFNINLPEDLHYALPDFVITLLAVYASAASFLSLVSLILGGTVQLGYTEYLLKQYSKANFDLKDLFSQFSRFGQGFAQSFLRGLYTFLWGLLFLIPGIVKSFAYAMTPFIMAENPEMTANEAITASKEMMDGHKGELFWLGLTFIGWDILNMFTLGIGSLFLNPYKNAAYAAFYKDLTSGAQNEA